MGLMSVANWSWLLLAVLLAVLVGHLVELVFLPVKGVSALLVLGNEQHYLMQLQLRRQQRLLEKIIFFS
jgi:hypothetical protein